MVRGTYTDARDALNYAYAFAPAVIAYASGGWVIYSPTSPIQDVTPELLVIARGTPPIPLSDDGQLVWDSILRAAITHAEGIHATPRQSSDLRSHVIARATHDTD